MAGDRGTVTGTLVVRDRFTSKGSVERVAAVTEIQPRASPGLAMMERPIWPVNPGQALGVRPALVSQTPDLIQPTKHPKTGSSEP